MQIGRVTQLAGPDGRRADLARRALLRHLLAPSERADRLHRAPDRRRDREPGRRAARSPRVRGPGQGRVRLRELAGRLASRGARDLRHDPVHPPGRADHLLRDGDVGRLADPRGRHAREAADAARTRASSSTSPRRGSRASPRTSRSTPARCSSCAGCSRRSTRGTRTGPPDEVHEDMERDRFFGAEEAVEYGLVDRIVSASELHRPPSGFAAAAAGAVEHRGAPAAPARRRGPARGLRLGRGERAGARALPHRGRSPKPSSGSTSARFSGSPTGAAARARRARRATARPWTTWPSGCARPAGRCGCSPSAFRTSTSGDASMSIDGRKLREARDFQVLSYSGAGRAQRTAAAARHGLRGRGVLRRSAPATSRS